MNYKIINMKNILQYGVFLTIVLILTSCNGEEKLANALVGTWQGDATEMISSKKKNTDHSDGIQNLICTPKITFVKNDTENGGTFTLTAEYLVTQGVDALALPTAVNATVSGKVSAEGTWKASDDDEIKLTVSPASINVETDPTSVNLTYAKVTDAPVSDLIQIKEKVADNLLAHVKIQLEGRISKLKNFDDIKINNDVMQTEVGKIEINFTRRL